MIFPLVLDKKEIKEEMLSECQVLIADFHNILIGNVKKLVPNFFDEKNNMCFRMKIHRVLEFNQSQ